MLLQRRRVQSQHWQSQNASLCLKYSYSSWLSVYKHQLLVTFNIIIIILNIIIIIIIFILHAKPVDTGNEVHCCQNWQQIGNKVDCCRCGRLCCQYGWLCRQCVWGQSNMVVVDFQQSQPCWIQLCRQCVLGFRHAMSVTKLNWRRQQSLGHAPLICLRCMALYKFVLIDWLTDWLGGQHWKGYWWKMSFRWHVNCEGVSGEGKSDVLTYPTSDCRNQVG